MTGVLEDSWSPPAQHEAIAARHSQFQLVVVPGAGHMIMPRSARGGERRHRQLARAASRR